MFEPSIKPGFTKLSYPKPGYLDLSLRYNVPRFEPGLELELESGFEPEFGLKIRLESKPGFELEAVFGP